MRTMACDTCGNKTEHEECYAYKSHSDGDRYQKTVVTFCRTCRIISSTTNYTMLFLVVAENKVSYFKWEGEAKKYAKKHNTEVVEDVLVD